MHGPQVLLEADSLARVCMVWLLTVFAAMPPFNVTSHGIDASPCHKAFYGETATTIITAW
jgi:hypothetical protein